MGIEIMTKDEVLEVIRHHEGKIKPYGVKKLGLFGSFARDEQNLASDLDLLVEFESEKKTFDNLVNLSFMLEEVLKRRVELVTTESLSPYIGPHILKEVEYVTFSS
ncbi:MAG: nucleotidyltransferase [Candidatus Cloacimonadota bacterium]|nr:MAG: nucleotidyltransferase [Candidatus Cloacimonadota bacterium]